MSVITFKYEIPIEETMAFEGVYHEKLQVTLPRKKEFRGIPGSIFVWMLVEGALAGEAYGFPFANFDEPIQGLGFLGNLEKDASIYCYSNTLLPAFQNRGLGTVLKAHWLGLAVGKGFGIVYGHARHGASQKVNAKFGAVFLRSFPDWACTGEEYWLYRLQLI